MSLRSPRLLFLNVGHFVDHMCMLIFAKAAFTAGLAFGLAPDGAYAEMIPYGIPSLVLFGAAAPVAAHLADIWSRNGMITVFFIGIGLSAIATSFAQTLQVGAGLAVLGLFAAIYHPVGIAMVVEGGGNVGTRVGANGVWGNMGVAAAPLVTGFLLAVHDWRLAFALPGAVAVAIGIGYALVARSGRLRPPPSTAREKALVGFAPGWQRALLSIALATTAGGFVFGALTFLVPRLFEVRLPGVSSDVAVTGALAAAVYAVAAFAQVFVGRLIDRRRLKPVLLAAAAGQPLLIGLMAVQTDWALFLAALLAMGFVFGQIPIADTVLARYVPDQWRAKMVAAKVGLNLVAGAGALMAARWILASGGGFETVLGLLAVCAACVVAAALLLPARSGAELDAAPAPAE